MSTADDRAIACLAALVSRPRFAFLADRYVALAEATTRLKSVLQSTEQKIQESKRAMLLVNASRAESSRDCTPRSAEADTQQDTASDEISGQLPDEARRTQSAPSRSLSPSFAWGDADEGDTLELPAAPLNAPGQPPPAPFPQAPEYCVCNSYACPPTLEASHNEGHVANSIAKGHVPLDDCNSAQHVMAVVGSGVCEPRGTISKSAPVRNEACAEDAGVDTTATPPGQPQHMPTTGCSAHTDDLARADLCPSPPSEPVSPSSESPELQQAQDVPVIQSPQHSVDNLGFASHLSSSPLPSIYPNSFLSRGASPPSEAHILKYQDAPRKSARLAAQSQSAETLDAPPSTDPTTPRLLKRRKEAQQEASVLDTPVVTSASATADSEADHPSKRRRSTRLGPTNDHLPATNDQETDEASSPHSDEDDSYIDEEDSRSSGDLTRPYACTACDVAFAKVAFLKRHLRGRAHNSEGGAYECTLCGVRFVRRHHLSRHLSSAAHGGERDFPCSVVGCRQAFTRREHLKRHLQNVHKR